MRTLYQIARPFLLRVPPETAHRLTLGILRTGLMKSAPMREPLLSQTLWGKDFSSPLGLAAGFDKNAEALAPLLALGFGFVEAGTVTPLAQAGNPLPRVFREPRQQAIINAMGFPGHGLAAFQRNLESYRAAHPASAPIGVNIGMNKDQTVPAHDYRMLVRKLGPFADYLTINISSPNTPGLRNLQQTDNLAALLQEIMEERAALPGMPPPLLVKLSPDIDAAERPAIAQTLLAAGVDGLVLTNTTLVRPDDLPKDFAARRGGLSGRSLTERALETTRDFYRLTAGRLPIIGVGGISNAADAYARLRAGASLLQLYSALVFQGPAIINDIHTGLGTLLRRDGLSSITQAIGLDAERVSV